MRKKIIKEHFPVCMLERRQILALKNLSTTRDILKLSFIFDFGFPLPPLHKTHLSPLLLPFQWAGEVGGFNIYNWLNTSTLCHISFSSVLNLGAGVDFFSWDFYTKCKQKVMDMPMVWRKWELSCKWKGGRWVQGGRGEERGAWEMCHRL